MKKKKYTKKKKSAKKKLIKKKSTKKKLTKKKSIKKRLIKKKSTKKKLIKKKLIKKKSTKKKLIKKRLIKKKSIKKRLTKKKIVKKRPIKKRPIKKKPIKKKKLVEKVKTIKGIRYEKISNYIRRFKLELQELYPDSEIKEFEYVGKYVNIDTMEFVDKVSDFSVEKFNRVFLFYYYKYEYNRYKGKKVKRISYIKGSLKRIGSNTLVDKKFFLNNLDNYIQDIKKDVEVNYKGQSSDFTIEFLGIYGIYFMIV